MAFTNQAGFPTKIQAWALQIANATGTTITQIFAAGANGSIVESVNVSNNDGAAAYLISLYLNDGSVNHLLGSVNVPLSAGNAIGVPAVDALRGAIILGLPADANGNPSIYVPSGWSLRAGSGTTVTAAKTVDVVCMGSDY